MIYEVIPYMLKLGASHLLKKGSAIRKNVCAVESKTFPFRPMEFSASCGSWTSLKGLQVLIWLF